MEECNTCKELVASDARICPKCGANRYKKVTPIFIFINAIQSIIYVMVIGISMILINKDFHDKFINDTVYYVAIIIVLVLLTYKDYNTKLTE